LVSLANHSLKEVRPTILAAIQVDNDPEECFTIVRYDSMIHHTQAGWWIRVKRLSDDGRWRMLESNFLSNVQADGFKKMLKSSRQTTRKSMKSFAEEQLGNDEMCTNCFRLESGLEEGKKLMKCACKQVNYCSPECQKEHWKILHRKECGAPKGKSKKK
jgi:hypothetical protein